MPSIFKIFLPNKVSFNTSEYAEVADRYTGYYVQADPVVYQPHDSFFSLNTWNYSF